MSKRARIFVGSGVAALALVVAAGTGVWYFVLRDDAPPAVSLGSALDEIEDTSATPTSTAKTATASPTGSATDVAASDEGGLDGSWSVDQALESFVGYRVEEELANVGFTTAVGRTPAVDATLAVEGGVLTAATVEADLTELASDQGRRDQALRNQGLETSQFPTATFTLTEPVELPAALVEGEAVQVTLSGEITLHGVTKAVEIPVDAQLSDGVIAAVGSLAIVFADYEMSTSSAASVLSVEDNGVMELQLFLQRS